MIFGKSYLNSRFLKKIKKFKDSKMIFQITILKSTLSKTIFQMKILKCLFKKKLKKLKILFLL